MSEAAPLSARLNAAAVASTPRDVEPDALWQVRLLGGLEVSDGRQSIVRLPSRAVAALLARLALAPQRAHSREQLIELLWPGVALDVGRNRLRQALSTLKSILEPASRVPPQPVLLADRNHIRVAPGGLSCDALQFEQHARGGRGQAALGLYRGELLPGFYDDWIDEERLRLAALHERLALTAELPRVATAPGAARALDAADAGVSLPVAARGVRVLLPSYITRLFGADEQAARLRGMVLAHRLVTLVGPGGAGKTRLAVETAHALAQPEAWARADANQAFDLVAFVSLVACHTRAQAADAIAGALHLAPGADDPQLAVVDALAGRRVLLLLDNFEQLVEAAQDLVAQLVARLPALHLVVTSRRALGVDGEREFLVAALELPAAGATQGDAAANPAVALFAERARAVRADFHVGRRNEAVLVELVRALEGMPLAIELAASRVRSITPADMLARLRGAGTPRLDLLARGGPRGPLDARHASMQRVIEWSWDLLPAPQARLLSALTVFPGGFSAEAAAMLAADENFDAALLLDDLVASSLVHTRSHADGILRFGLYEPIREFAAARLAPAKAAQWRAHLRAWALRWAGALPLTPPLAVVRAEMSNLLAALASAVEDGAPQDAVHLLHALRRSLEDVELPAEGLLHAQAAVEGCADPLLKARGHTLLGPLLFTAGQPEAALEHAERGAQHQPLDAAQRARALHALARVRWRSRRRAEEVEPLLDEAQALVGAAGEPELRASLFALRAFVTNAHHRDHAAAERLHAQALALWEQAGNQHAIDSGRYNLAVCAQSAGHNGVALQRLEPIVSSARELHDWRRLSQSLNVRGNAHSGLRRWAMAHADYRECIATAWSFVASHDLAYGLWNLPRALAHLRLPERALHIAAFAATFWRTRFGELGAADLRYLHSVRRLCARQLDAARVEVLWREGEQLSLSQAVALALSPLPAA